MVSLRRVPERPQPHWWPGQMIPLRESEMAAIVLAEGHAAVFGVAAHPPAKVRRGVG